MWAVIARHEEFGGAFELEAYAQGYQQVRPNVFSVNWTDGGGLDEQQGVWKRMAGLRLIMEPLVVAATAKDLVAKTMDLRLELVQDSFSISHERLERNEGAKELNQVVLRKHLGAVLGNPSWAAYKDEPGPTRPRYVVLEMTEGYALGYVVYAPPLLGVDYSSAPQTWSAALPPELAAVAVNLVAKPGDTLLDPCCGSGTILFEAYRRGVHSQGSDVNPTVLKMAAANFRHLGVPCRASWEWPQGTDQAARARAQKTSPSRARKQRALCDWTNGNLNDSCSHMVSVRTSKLEHQSDERAVDTEKSVDAEALDKNNRTPAIELSLRDAQEVATKSDCLVTNLPYNRFLEVSVDDIERLVRNLRSCTRSFVFFAGAPLRATLTKAGYEVVVEVDVGNRGKRFMSWARSSDALTAPLTFEKHKAFGDPYQEGLRSVLHGVVLQLG